MKAHGTISTYNNYRCRCAKCRAAWNRYMRHLRRVRVILRRCVSCNRRVVTLTRCAECNARMLAGAKRRVPSSSLPYQQEVTHG